MKPEAILLLLFATPALAVELPPECRVANRGGMCLPANLATIGYLHNIPALKAFAPNRIVTPWRCERVDRHVKATLHARGVKWQGFDHGSYDRSLLPLANTRGVIVSVKPGTPWMHGMRLSVPHSIILTRYDDAGVSFYCPDNAGRIWHATPEWLELSWSGNSMVFGGGE